MGRRPLRRRIHKTAAEKAAYRLGEGVHTYRGPLLPARRDDPGLPVSLERWAGFALIVVAHSIERAYAQAMKDLGISLRDFVLLSEIDQRAGLCQAALAWRVGLTRARVSEQLAVLTTAGYVEREINTLDLRARRLWVSSPGHVVLEEARARLTELDLTWLRSLDDYTRPSFTSALQRLPPAINGLRWRDGYGFRAPQKGEAT